MKPYNVELLCAACLVVVVTPLRYGISEFNNWAVILGWVVMSCNVREVYSRCRGSPDGVIELGIVGRSCESHSASGRRRCSGVAW